MAARLVVVLSQSSNAAPNRRHAEEELIARLMFEQGVDINVIPPLEHLDSDSTGLLCLEGITSDMVMLAWQDSATILGQLSEYGISGRRGQTTLEPEDVWSTDVADDAGQLTRTIYCLDLRADQDAERYLSEIRRIRDDARVQIFNILGTLPVLERSVSRTESSPRASQVVRPAAEKATYAEAAAKQETRRDTPRQPQAQPTVAGPSLPTNEEGWSEARLDNLLDDLDAFDS